MDATRRARIESFIQQEISRILSREIRDPRLSLVTITRVEMVRDASYVKLFVSVLSESEDVSEATMSSCLEGLTSAAGFLRHQLSKVLQLRHTPELRFEVDKGIHNSLRVFKLLKELEPHVAPAKSE